MDTHILECENIELIYPGENGEQRILYPTTCTFNGGQPTLITGDTGCGKSSFLHILAALQRPTAGVVLADTVPISRLLALHRDKWRRNAGLLFQHSLLFQDLTVLENVMQPLIPRGGAINDIRDTAMEMLDLLGMGNASAQEARLLSGGESQRVALSRALVADPLFLFLDEPTAHQDTKGVDVIVNCLSRVTEKQGVVVTVSHDPRLIESNFFGHRYGLHGGALDEI